MKKIMFVMLCACSSVYAQSRVLPPVIDNSIYPSATGLGSSAASENAIYEVLGRLEQLQLEVQQLRGVVEEQSQTIGDLKKRQGNIYSDLDLRLQDLTNANTLVKSEDVKAGLRSAVKPVAKVNASTQLSSKSVKENALVNEKARYQAAYELLRNGHNSRAIAAFQILITDSPSGEYADNSQYWLGEAFKVNQNMDAAKEAFLKVVMNYVGSPKVPDALLKLGYIEFEEKNMAKARDYFTQITVAHPQTTAAHLANKKLMQMTEMQR